MFPAKHMISGRISISTVCSLHFVRVNRNNLEDVICSQICIGDKCFDVISGYYCNIFQSFF